MHIYWLWHSQFHDRKLICKTYSKSTQRSLSLKPITFKIYFVHIIRFHCYTCLFGVYCELCPPRHIQLNYRCPIKKSDHVRATSHTRLRACVHYTSSTLIGGKGGARPHSLHTTLEGPPERVCECKMGVKSRWIHSYMASNGPCLMVTWIVFKYHHLEVGLTQNQETIAF